MRWVGLGWSGVEEGEGREDVCGWGEDGWWMGVWEVTMDGWKMSK